MNSSKGFSLIELLMAIAIIGIITAIAVPSYAGYMKKARRTDAMDMLQRAAGEQERFLSEQNRYATSMQEMGFSANQEPSKEGHYMISVISANATQYLLTANPVAGGQQADDTDCLALSLRSNGQKSAAGPLGIKCW